MIGSCAQDGDAVAIIVKFFISAFSLFSGASVTSTCYAGALPPFVRERLKPTTTRVAWPHGINCCPRRGYSPDAERPPILHITDVKPSYTAHISRESG